MAQETLLEFRTLPGMFANYFRVVTSGKPMLAPAGTQMGRTVVSVASVRIRAAHLRRYRSVCGISESDILPHAYPHVLAMPLHMYVFTSPSFPVKVLGLIHLRNTIKYYRALANECELSIRVECDTMRETGSGQEYDLITRVAAGGV